MDQHQVNHLNRLLVEDLIDDETAMITSTVLRGHTVLRMCTINPRTTEEDIQATMERLDELLGAFVEQRRMKLPTSDYVPCYTCASRE